MFNLLYAALFLLGAIMSAQRNGYDWAREDHSGKLITALMLGGCIAGIVWNLWPVMEVAFNCVPQ